MLATTTTADAIYCFVHKKTENILILKYKYKKLNGFFNIEIPVTTHNAHIQEGDRVTYKLGVLV